MSKKSVLLLIFIFSILAYSCVSDSKDITNEIANEEFVIVTERDEYLVNETVELTFTTKNLKITDYKFSWSSEIGTIVTIENRNAVYIPESNFLGKTKLFLEIKTVVNDLESSFKTYTKEIEFKTVSETNLRPTAIIDKAAKTYFLDTVYTLDGGKSSDPNGFNLEYEWKLITKPDGSNLTLSSNDSIKSEVTFDKIGQYQFSLIVKNQFSNSFADFILIDVTDERALKPVASASENLYMKFGEKPYFHANYSFDNNSDESLTYLWTITSKPENSIANIQHPNAVSSYLDYDSEGIYKIELKVYDKSNLFTTDEVIIEIVNDYDSYYPVAYTGKNLMINKNIYTELSAEDSLRSFFYKWELIKKPFGSYIDIENKESLKARIKPDKKGEYDIRLTTYSSNSASKEDMLKLYVINSIPTVQTDGSITLNKSQLVNLNLVANDSDNDSLTFNWSVVSKPNSANFYISSMQDKNPEFQAFTTGIYELEVFASDSEDLSKKAKLIIQVN